MLYLVNKTNTAIKLAFATHVVDLLPYGHYEVLDNFFLPEIQQLVLVYDGKLELVDDIAAHIEEKQSKLEKDIKDVMDKAVNDLTRLLTLVSNGTGIPIDVTKDKIRRMLNSIISPIVDDEKRIEELYDSIIKEVPLIKSEPLQKILIINKIAIQNIVTSFKITDEKKLEIIKKIADSVSVQYSSRAGFKSIAEKLIG